MGCFVDWPRDAFSAVEIQPFFAAGFFGAATDSLDDFVAALLAAGRFGAAAFALAPALSAGLVLLGCFAG
jgi:hypothetical protein